MRAPSKSRRAPGVARTSWPRISASSSSTTAGSRSARRA